MEGKTVQEMTLSAAAVLIQFAEAAAEIAGSDVREMTMTVATESGKEYEIIVRETKNGPFQ